MPNRFTYHTYHTYQTCRTFQTCHTRPTIHTIHTQHTIPHPHHTTGGEGKISYGASIWDPSHGGGGRGGVAGPGAYIHLYTRNMRGSLPANKMFSAGALVRWKLGRVGRNNVRKMRVVGNDATLETNWVGVGGIGNLAWWQFWKHSRNCAKTFAAGCWKNGTGSNQKATRCYKRHVEKK